MNNHSTIDMRQFGCETCGGTHSPDIDCQPVGKDDAVLGTDIDGDTKTEVIGHFEGNVMHISDIRQTKDDTKNPAPKNEVSGTHQNTTEVVTPSIPEDDSFEATVKSTLGAFYTSAVIDGFKRVDERTGQDYVVAAYMPTILAASDQRVIEVLTRLLEQPDQSL
ncbi:hypothetical protein [Nakamurella sp. PAMC28650]|uniref:hypothetical protein n=1 Tax=Nakamurella sp. PAMC28650 TaxID=2762325 RepID=UPI00164DEF1D|nr:hypothetical protein [Nakamurella sp. PAMC28650]QNK82576.1 hypothetical protein H7F38_07680 [Nakamurella sp. PAMC28650]